MRGYPHFSFWISITLAKVYFFPVVITFAKIHHSVLGGTVLKIRGLPNSINLYTLGARNYSFWATKPRKCGSLLRLSRTKVTVKSLWHPGHTGYSLYHIFLVVVYMFNDFATPENVLLTKLRFHKHRWLKTDLKPSVPTVSEIIVCGTCESGIRVYSHTVLLLCREVRGLSFQLSVFQCYRDFFVKRTQSSCISSFSVALYCA